MGWSQSSLARDAKSFVHHFQPLQICPNIPSKKPWNWLFLLNWSNFSDLYAKNGVLKFDASAPAPYPNQIEPICAFCCLALSYEVLTSFVWGFPLMCFESRPNFIVLLIVLSSSSQREKVPVAGYSCFCLPIAAFLPKITSVYNLNPPPRVGGFSSFCVLSLAFWSVICFVDTFPMVSVVSVYPILKVAGWVTAMLHGLEHSFPLWFWFRTNVCHRGCLLPACCSSPYVRSPFLASNDPLEEGEISAG